MDKRMLCACVACALAAVAAYAAAPGKVADSRHDEAVMPAMIEQFTADSRSLERSYSLNISPAHTRRFEKFFADTQSALAAIKFDSLSHEDQIDYLLLKNRISSDLHELSIRKKQIDEMQPLLPFAKAIEDIMETKRMMQRPDAEKDAAALSEMVKEIKATESAWILSRTTVA